MVGPWKTPLWPKITNATEARTAVAGAVRWSTIWAVISGVLALIALFSGQAITARGDPGTVLYDGWSLLDAGLFGLVAWKIRSMSKGWAIAGLVLGSLNLAASLVSGMFSPIHLFVYTAILFAFINGVRGAFAYERFCEIETAASLGLGPVN